ncbi:MAG: helix-turn-helix domain-containing protein [Odoribacter sp.]|nr:helix-turn-helix domain-containing protein [Odoribacter sp.]
MESVIDYDRAQKLREGSIEFAEIKDSYLFCTLSKGCGKTLGINEKALKLTGTLLILVRDGDEFDIEINMESHHIRRNTLIVGFPGTVVQLQRQLPDNIEAHILYFNLSFLQNVNINMSSIALPPMIQRPEPVRELTDQECELLMKYLELLQINTVDDTNRQINKSIAASLLAALFYQLVQFYHKRITDMPDQARTVSRRNEYVREFLKLVHIHFVKERSVTFYAEKLYISPKYLSLLVKESTGRSASRWIDDFVLMEAKNMLRFSGKNIQQVALALNFSTQSSFGKYFKHLTGMSPSEYQKA